MASRSKCALVLVACVLLASCAQLSKWSQSVTNFGKEDWREEALEDFKPQLKLERVWKHSIGSSEEGRLKRNLLLLGGYLFTCDINGKAYALSARNGKVIWQNKLSDNLSSCVGGGKMAVLFGTAKGEVIAVVAQSGKPQWRRTLAGGAITAISRAHDGGVIVRSQSGNIHFLEINDGTIRWSMQHALPSLTIQGMSTPVFYKNRGLIGLDDGRLLLVMLSNGELLEEVRVGSIQEDNRLGRIVDIDGEMSVFDSTIYVASYHGRTMAIDLVREQVLWFSETSSQRGLYVDDDYVYLANANSEMVALDRFVGTEVWKNEVFSIRDLSPPLAYSEWVVVGDNEGNLYWLAKDSGDILASASSGDAIYAPPVRYKNRVIAIDETGELFALKVTAKLQRQRKAG